MFAINFIVLLDILELNLMPLLSIQRYFFRMISQYNFIASLVAQLSSITLVKRTMHFTMIMYIKACNFCYGSSILTRIYTMPLTSEGRELCRKLFEQWNNMANFDKLEARILNLWIEPFKTRSQDEKMADSISSHNVLK